MNLSLSPAQADLLVGALSFFFTVALLSYLIGDNPLYRLAIHLFIGVSVGYGVLVIIYQVLRPRLITPLSSGNMNAVALAIVPLLLFMFLVLKLNTRTSALGNIAIAFLIGVGTAVAIGGALNGTLLPQIKATWLSVMPTSGLAFLNNAIVVAGTLTTLLYFQFWLRERTPSGEIKRVALMRVVSGIGQVFLIITLGAIFGGIILSGIAVFSERLVSLYGWLLTLAP